MARSFLNLFETSDVAVIKSFIRRYVPENGGLQACRHGGCFEFVEAFIAEHDDAEMWETLELDDSHVGLPLVMSFELVNQLIASEKQKAKNPANVEYVTDIGITGGHAGTNMFLMLLASRHLKL